MKRSFLLFFWIYFQFRARWVFSGSFRWPKLLPYNERTLKIILNHLGFFFRLQTSFLNLILTQEIVLIAILTLNHMHFLSSLVLFGDFVKSLNSGLDIDNIINNEIFPKFNSQFHTTSIQILTGLNIILQYKLVPSQNSFTSRYYFNQPQFTYISAQLVRFLHNSKPNELVSYVNRTFKIRIAQNIMRMTNWFPI